MQISSVVVNYTVRFGYFPNYSERTFAPQFATPLNFMIRQLLATSRASTAASAARRSLNRSFAAAPLRNAEKNTQETLVDSEIHGDFRRAHATGARKTAVAQVWLRPGDGEMIINDQHPISYFDRPVHQQHLIEPFIATNTVGKWDVRAIVKGGGHTGQAQAIRHGIALALRQANPLKYTKPLRAKGLTTRDPRMVERKKPGQPKARKKFAWVKR